MVNASAQKGRGLARKCPALFYIRLCPHWNPCEQREHFLATAIASKNTVVSLLFNGLIDKMAISKPGIVK